MIEWIIDAQILISLIILILYMIEETVKSFFFKLLFILLSLTVIIIINFMSKHNQSYFEGKTYFFMAAHFYRCSMQSHLI